MYCMEYLEENLHEWLSEELEVRNSFACLDVLGDGRVGMFEWLAPLHDACASASWPALAASRYRTMWLSGCHNESLSARLCVIQS
jgi:hypothetical protein